MRVWCSIAATGVVLRCRPCPVESKTQCLLVRAACVSKQVFARVGPSLGAFVGGADPWETEASLVIVEFVSFAMDRKSAGVVAVDSARCFSVFMELGGGLINRAGLKDADWQKLAYTTQACAEPDPFGSDVIVSAGVEGAFRLVSQAITTAGDATE